MTGEPMGATAIAGLLRLAQLREAVASVALSHPDACACDVCRASQGDDGALARVMTRLA